MEHQDSLNLIKWLSYERNYNSLIKELGGVEFFKPWYPFECRNKLTLDTSPTLSSAASFPTHLLTNMRDMDLASTNCTSQIKAKFYFFIIHHETDGEHRATSQKGFV
jgi:hypothetical protein